MKYYLLSLLAMVLLMTGCATQPGGRGVRESAPGKIISTNALRVRTTAYTGCKNALGARLSHSGVISAASDWSQFPVGTRFKIRENGEQYIIDDYGSALVGTRTIDLCMPNNRAMRAWGVRHVEIDVLEWGSPRRSMEILAPRERSHYVRRMLTSLRKQTQGIPEKFHRVRL